MRVNLKIKLRRRSFAAMLIIINKIAGFFRWYKDNYIQSTIIIDLVGESRPCNCNGRSETCDTETGVCLVSCCLNDQN